MQDLYLKLGIDRGASAGEVQATLELKPALRDEATILLNAQKRALYDSTHSTLKLIGELRFRLELDSGRSWFLEHCPDYAFRRNAAKSPQKPGQDAKADTTARLNPAPRQAKSIASAPPVHSTRPGKWPVNWLVPAVLLTIGVILIAALLW